MHEVGHSLGLRHNFKASIMLRPDQINDTSITRVKGMTGSVMDYNPINIAPKGQKQGDYASTTIGPYDYWAIEYAYKPVEGRRGGRAQEDRRPVARPRPRLRDRRRLHEQRPAGQHLRPDQRHPGLRQDADGHGRRAAQGSRPEGRQGQRVVGPAPHARSASCISQFGNGAYLASEYIGGQSVNRDFKGTEKARDPDHPDQRRQAARGAQVAGRPDPHRQGLPVLAGLAPQADHRVVAGQPVLLLRRNGLPDLPDDPQHPGDRRSTSASTRACSSESRTRSCRATPAADPLKIAEIFRSLSDGIFTELAAPRPAARRRSPSRPSAATSSASTSSGSASMVLGPKNEPFYGLSYRYIVFFGDYGIGSARRQEPGAASPRGDRPEDRQAHRPEGHQDRRHLPGPSQGDPPPDRQGPEGEPQRQRALIGSQDPNSRN